MKKWFGIALVICIMLVTVPTTIAEDYRGWAQADSRWGSIHLGSSSQTMSSAGCLVTSVAKLLVQAGLEDANSFNPGTFVNWLNNNSGFSGASFYWSKPESFGFTNCGNLVESGSDLSSSGYDSSIVQWINQGYHLVINVKSGGHWVAVDEMLTKQNGTAYIMDSTTDSNVGIRLSDRYSTFRIIHAYTGGNSPYNNPVSFDTYEVEQTTEENIRAGVWLDNPKGKTLTTIGMQCGSNKDTAEEKAITGNVSWTRPHLIYNASDYFGKLASNRTYYIRYYVVTEGKKYYSNWIEATTVKGEVSFDTYSVDNLYHSDVCLSAWLDNPKGKTLSQIGIEAGKSKNNLTTRIIASNVAWSRSNQSAYLSATLGYLESNTRYYARYYALSSNKYYYSDWFDITTPAGGLSFDTYSVSDISDRSAVVGVWMSNPNAITLSEIGMMVGKTKTTTTRKRITGNVSWARPHLSYDVSQYCGNLEPDTMYYVAYYVKDGDKNYYTDWQTFRTKSGERYTVALNPNGGSVNPTSITVTYGATYGSLPKPTLQGYTFDDWYTSTSGGTKVTNTTKVQIAGNQTLYAHWTPNKYTFDLNVLVDGVLEKSPTSDIFVCDFYLNGILAKAGASDIADSFAYGTTYEIKDIHPTAPYVFDGVEVGALSGTIPASATEVRLRFVMGSYTVTYNANAGSDVVTNMPPNQTKTRGVGLTISGMIPKRQGYAFVGWGTSTEAATAAYQANGVYSVDADLQLYAIWKLDTFTVVYDANGGKNTPENQTKVRGVDLTITDAIPENDGYVFVNWNTAPDGSGDAYAPNGQYTRDTDATLYAQWREMYALTLPTGLKAIEEEAFMGVAAEVIVIPEGCLEIDAGAFQDCRALQRLYIPATVKSIDVEAFAGCDNLTIYAPTGSKAAKTASVLGIPCVITE